MWWLMPAGKLGADNIWGGLAGGPLAFPLTHHSYCQNTHTPVLQDILVDFVTSKYNVPVCKVFSVVLYLHFCFFYPVWTAVFPCSISTLGDGLWNNGLLGTRVNGSPTPPTWEQDPQTVLHLFLWFSAGEPELRCCCWFKNCSWILVFSSHWR